MQSIQNEQRVVCSQGMFSLINFAKMKGKEDGGKRGKDKAQMFK